MKEYRSHAAARQAFNDLPARVGGILRSVAADRYIVFSPAIEAIGHPTAAFTQSIR